MTEAEFYYNQGTIKNLKDAYPSFYSQLLTYVSSLPQKWFFVECYNPDCDGSRFSVLLHDGRNNQLSISATRLGTTYTFNVTRQ